MLRVPDTSPKFARQPHLQLRLTLFDRCQSIMKRRGGSLFGHRHKLSHQPHILGA